MPTRVLPPEHGLLATLLDRLLTAFAVDQPLSFEAPQLDDAAWVGMRLSELLPLSLEERQRMLEIDDPLQRLDALGLLLPRFQRD